MQQFFVAYFSTNYSDEIEKTCHFADGDLSSSRIKKFKKKPRALAYMKKKL